MVLTTADIVGLIVVWVLCPAFLITYRRRAKVLAVSGVILIALGFISIAGNFPTTSLLLAGLLSLVVAFFAHRSLDS